MKKLFLLIIITFIAGGAFLIRSRLLQGRQSAGLKITSEPKATIFLDGKHLGQTPFEDRSLKSGEQLLKLVPESEGFSPWEQKLKLTPGVLTAVNYRFADQEEFTSSEVLSLEPLANKKTLALAVISSPDGALVKADGVTRGFSPISLEDVSEGDHLISLSLPGYLESTVKAKAVLGHRLVINIKLAQDKIDSETATTSAKEKQEAESKDKEVLEKPYVEIKDTPTGWLRVRLEPTTTATEAAKVNPGEKYPLLDEEGGWYQIRYAEDKEGWISGQYATKYE